MTEKVRIIKYTPLKPIEIGVVLAYFVIALEIWLVNEWHIISYEQLKSFTHFYFLAIPFVLIGMMYSNLRNIYFFMTWVGIGLGQLLIYPKLTGLTQFQYLIGNAFSGMQALLPTLLMFQVLRILFISTHNKELIVTLRKFRMSMWEEEEKRYMTWIEVGYSLIIYATIIFSIW